jgi:hypothetical protein
LEFILGNLWTIWIDFCFCFLFTSPSFLAALPFVVDSIYFLQNYYAFLLSFLLSFRMRRRAKLLDETSKMTLWSILDPRQVRRLPFPALPLHPSSSPFVSHLSFAVFVCLNSTCSTHPFYSEPAPVALILRCFCLILRRFCAAIALLSRCLRAAFALHLRCFRAAFALLSRCFRAAFALLSRCFRAACALLLCCLRCICTAFALLAIFLRRFCAAFSLLSRCFRSAFALRRTALLHPSSLLFSFPTPPLSRSSFQVRRAIQLYRNRNSMRVRRPPRSREYNQSHTNSNSNRTNSSSNIKDSSDNIDHGGRFGSQPRAKQTDFGGSYQKGVDIEDQIDEENNCEVKLALNKGKIGFNLGNNSRSIQRKSQENLLNVLISLGILGSLPKRSQTSQRY